MSTGHFCEWQPIRVYGEGIQPHTGKHWNCVPAWDLTALYEEPDEVKTSGDRRLHLFWNRHVDRRFHIEYPHASKDHPRVQGHTIGDPAKEWDTLIEWRDRYLSEAGLTLDSPDTEIAQCLAETFAYRNIKRKPPCAVIKGEKRRDVNHPVEGLLHGSHCVGCAVAFMALADACGLPARNIGCGAHWVAEVYAGGKWHMVDSVGRHEKNDGLATYFESSYIEALLDPMGDHGENVFDSYREGLWRRPNPQFHLHTGMWGGPATVRYGANSAYAFYPDDGRWGVKSFDGKRLVLINRSGGFYWPSVYGGDGPLMESVRRAALPLPIAPEGPSRTYFFHPFRPGEKLRQSLWLDALDDMKALEIVFPFGRSRATDFSADTGRQVVVRVGGFERSLAALGAWPPADAKGGTINDPTRGDNGLCTVRVPVEALKPHAVNWVVLEHRAATTLYVPCLPAVLEPYIAPLWSETEDRFNPPMPADW